MQQDNFNKMVGVLAAGVSIACISSFVTSKILNNEPCEVYYEEYIYEAVLEEETQEETELSEEQRIAKIQEIIGADPDGVWGNESEAKLREYLGIEVQVQRTRQTQPVVVPTQRTRQTQPAANRCRNLTIITNDIGYIDRSYHDGNISYSTWNSRRGALQDEYARCDPRLQ